MKILFKVFGFFIVLLIFLTTRCERQSVYEEIAVEYAICPCNDEHLYIKPVVRNDVLLFDVNKTTFDEMKGKAQVGDEAEFICYFPEADSALYYNFQGFTSIGHICNFPVNAKGWSISEEGVCISFSADEFTSCNGCNTIGLSTCGELVLKSLKKRLE